MSYENDTLNAYRSKARAAEYKRYHTRGWSWGRITSWREQRAIARELGRYRWTASDRLLDIPCGTGLLGKVLHPFPFRITASDISPEMMELAHGEYPQDRPINFLQADITRTPFPRASFECVVTLGFLHRVPPEIKNAALRELAALSNRVVILTCSVDTSLQRLKRALVSRFWRSYAPAPFPVTLQEIIAAGEAQGLRLVRAFMILPFLSSVAMLVLEKPEASSSAQVSSERDAIR